MRTLIIAFVVFLVLPLTASAAIAVVSVDIGSDEINALEGSVIFPDSVYIDTVSTGSSVISMWVVSPTIDGHTISFSGITPGGFSGTHAIFSIVGNFTADDIVRTRFAPVTALKNDGLGTQGAAELRIALTPAKFDTEPPEIFTPVIAHDPNIFDGKYFLVFSTQDKSSGIVRYEIREGWWELFHEAMSPYLLKKQELTTDIYVKAIDNAGNERVAVVRAEHGAIKTPIVFIVILIVLTLGALIYKKRWLKFTQ